MNIKVHNIEGKTSGKEVILNEGIFAVEPNDHAIYLDVKWYLAQKRQGTHKAKERAEVSGSTKKIKKQKGTGTARAGSIKSPVFRGGGTVFGPSPRDYSFKLNKKVKRLARKSALTYKAKNESIILLEDFNLDTPKTKDFKTIIEKLGIVAEKSLFLLPEKNDNIFLSARNLQGVKVAKANNISSYDILNAKKVVILESAVETLNEYLS